MLARNTLLAVCLYIFSYGGPPIFVTIFTIERFALLAKRALDAGEL